jgi:hypothetical protein
LTAPHPALLQLIAGGEARQVGDEDAFLASTAEHRMVAVVLAALGAGKIQLASNASLTLGVWALAERRRHVVFWETISEITNRLDGLGARAAIIKGVATEARWYDELGQRVCTDVDLLIAPDAFDNIGEVVGVLDPDRGSGSSIEWLVERRMLQHVDLRMGPVQVDLHLDPFKVGLPTRQLEEIWASMGTIDRGHGAIQVLRPEIELVLLLLHLNKDRFAFLGTFLDIRQILELAAIDWAYLRAFVAEEGFEVIVWKSLATVASVLTIDVDIPGVRGLRSITWEMLWGRNSILGGYEGRDRAPSIQRFLPYHARRRYGDMLREASRQLIPPRQLIEVAGRLLPGTSYLKYLTVDRFRADSDPGRL